MKQIVRHELDLIKSMFGLDVKDEEILRALSIARAKGLNPLTDVHFVKMGQKVAVVENFVLHIRKAERSGLLKGWKVFVGKDDYGVYAEVQIFRKDWEFPFEWRTYLNEVKRETPIWKQAPIYMLRKTAIAQAFRLCFPTDLVEEDLAYLDEETDSLAQDSVQEPEDNQEDVITDKQRKYLWAFAKEKGLREEDVRSIIREFGYESTKDIKKGDLNTILKYIELYSQQEEAQ